MDRTDLQHDAFKINGDYLEDLISGYVATTDTAVNSGKVYFSLSGGKYTKVTPTGNENPATQGWYEKNGYGYMTHKAAGRESLDKDVSTYENGSDGEVLKRSRFPKRIIEISFVVQGSSLADMREKMHKLQTALNVENAEIIFNDDPNNYYIATPVMTATVNDVWNGATGTYTLICHDPFKYSKTLTTVTTSTKTETVTDEDGNTSSVTSQVLTTDNTGGYKTYPSFQVQFATDEDANHDLGSDADCGYVLFAKGGTDYSIQIGEDEEKDTETVWVVSHKFAASSRGGFTDDNTITPQYPAGWTYNGSSGVSAKGLWYNSSPTVAGKYHGPFVVFTIPYVAQYATGDFTFNFKHIYACAYDTATGKKQGGNFYLQFLDSNDEVVFAYGMEKNDKSSLNAREYIYDYNNGWSKATKISAAYTSASGYKSKSDTTGRLPVCSVKRKLTYDDDNNLTDCRTIVHTSSGKEYTIVESTPKTIVKVAFFFGKYGSNNYLHSNRVTVAQLIVGNVDVVNSFGSGDYAEVDCGKASIVLNNKQSDSLGDVGNNWEDMYLDTGTNTIYVQYSDWVTSGYEPTITMTYRKRWL